MATLAPNNMPAAYSVSDLDRRLQEACPEEFAAMASLDQPTFIRLTTRPADYNAIYGDSAMCTMALHTGTSTSEFTNGHPVYHCIGGADNNQIALYCNDNLEIFNLNNLICVTLKEPFDGLCHDVNDPEIGHESERVRLRAYACYLFLRAGYVNEEEWKPYGRFEEGLRLACKSLA